MTSQVGSSAPTLGSGNLRDAVRLPLGENVDEWMAVNIIDVFNQIHMLYGTICDVCTHESCPVMSAGPNHEYYWKEGEATVPTSAPMYIDYVMTWVQDQLDDDTVFPSRVGQAFPRNFKTVCESIMKRLLRIYAHVYHRHFGRLNELKAVAHANTSLKQFVLFAKEFNLISDRELVPLQSKIRELFGKSNSTV